MPHRLRFTGPADSRRPHKACRYDAWSPKAQRLIKLFGSRALSAWIAIEANPSFTGLCERPVAFTLAGGPRLIDFWAQGHSTEEFWVLVREKEMMGQGPDFERFSPFDKWAQQQGIKARYFAPSEQLLSRQAETNWSRILPYLAANRELVTSELIERVQAACAQPTCLGEIESRWTHEDPTLVRTTVFSLLHRGILKVPTIDTAEITAQTEVSLA